MKIYCKIKNLFFIIFFFYCLQQYQSLRKLATENWSLWANPVRRVPLVYTLKYALLYVVENKNEKKCIFPFFLPITMQSGQSPLNS